MTNVKIPGETYNNIPEEAFMALDLRSESNEEIEHMKELVVRAVTKACEAVGAEATLTFNSGVPAAEFDDDMIKLAEETILDVFGEHGSIGIFKIQVEKISITIHRSCIAKRLIWDWERMQFRDSITKCCD